MATIRCPHCGSPVMVRGNRWECGWCGDFGNISSLFPSEQAKLAPKKSTPKITLSFTVSVEDTTPPPRHFTRTELVDMVRRWDFSENEWASRDLLIADFPDAVRRWTEEELEDMDTQDLLCETGDSDPPDCSSDDEAVTGHRRKSHSGTRGGRATIGMGYVRSVPKSVCPSSPFETTQTR